MHQIQTVEVIKRLNLILANQQTNFTTVELMIEVVIRAKWF